MQPYSVFVTTNHQQYIVTPAQRQEASINKTGWQLNQRPFFFICLPDHDLLQFSIKTYPSRKNFATHFQQLNKDDETNLLDVFGCIRYEGEGVYIHGDASVSPLISIFRYTQKKTINGAHKAVTSEKSNDDILLAEEFKKILGDSHINIVTDAKVHVHGKGQVTEYMINSDQGGAHKILCACQRPSIIQSLTISMGTENSFECGNYVTNSKNPVPFR